MKIKATIIIINRKGVKSIVHEMNASSLEQEMIETFRLFSKAEWREHSIDGLKSSEVRVLLCLKFLSEENDDGVNISDISKRLSVTSPTVTQIIKNLSIEGYVERYNDARDKRITLIRSTDTGTDIAERAAQRYRSYFSGLIKKLGEEKSEMLIVLLNQAFSHFQEFRPSNK